MAQAYKTPFTIQAGQVTGTLSGFVAPVVLSGARYKTIANGGYVINGNDIRPYSDSGLTTALTYQQKFYDGVNGIWIGFVNVSAVVGLVIYFGYGDSTLTSDGSSSSVWPSGAKTVLPLGNGSALNLNDATANGNNFTGTNTPTAAAGLIDGAMGLLSASAQYATEATPSLTNLTTETYLATVKATSLPNAYNAVLSKTNGAEYSQLFVKSDGTLAIYLDGTTGSSNYDGTGSHTLSTGTFYRIGLTYDPAGGLIGYVGGASDGTGTAEGDLNSNSGSLQVGNDSNTAGRNWNGSIGDVQVWDSAKSPDYMAADSNAFTNNTAFWLEGSQTAVAAAGTITAVRIASAAAHNGWVAEIEIAGLSTGGTYAMGLGSRNDPSAAKIAFSVSSPGYDASGGAVTIVRTVYGTHEVRKPYPNPTVNDEAVSGGALTVRVALSDFIFSGDTVTVTIGSGFYTQGGTPNGAVSAGGTVINNSTLAHPKVIANWSWPGWQKVSGPSFDVRCVAFHRSAINGKPVACVVFTATDQHSHSVSVTVTGATIDPLMEDYGKVSEYIATISTSTFTAGDQITVNFKAYPWVGDSGSTLDTSDGVNTQPTPKYAPQFYVYDGGTYGTSAAVVDSTFGSDTTGVAVDEKTFDSLRPPPAYRTINKAVAAINSRNNTVYGRNDAAGSVHLKAGNHTWTGASNSISATVGKVWCTVRPLGSTPRASVIINAVSGTQGFNGTPVKVWNCSINVATGPVSLFTDITYMWMDQCTFICNGTTAIYQTVLYYMTRNSIGAIAHDLTPFGGEVSNAALIRGNDLYGCGGTPVWTTLGNTNSVIHQNIFSNEPAGGPTANTMPILAFNTMYRQDVSVEMACQIHNATTGILGAAIVQNIFENNSSGELELFITADASTSNPANNVLMWHNTLVGGRINRGYNDTGSSSLLRTLWSEVGNLIEKEALKSDTFPTADAARTGNWPVLYGVGRRGCMNVEATPLAASGQFQLEFDGINSYAPAKNGGTNPITSATNPIAFSGLLGRLAWNGSTANVGSGDYRMQPHSLLRNLIPSGGAVLPYDIFGVPRKNDGTGAAGATEFNPGSASKALFDECLEIASWFDSDLVASAIRWFDEDLTAPATPPTFGNASMAEFDPDLEIRAWFDQDIVAQALRWFDDDLTASDTSSVVMPTISSGATINAPTLAYGITLPTIASASGVNAPSVAYPLILPTIASGAAVNAPTVAYGISLPTIAAGTVLNVPTLAYAVTLPTIAAGSTVNAPTVSPGAVTLVAPTIASAAATFAPTLAYQITMPTIAAGASLFSPAIADGSDILTLPTIGSGAVLNAPTLAYAITLPFLASGTAVNVPTLAYELNLPFIAAGSTTTAPTLAYAVTLPFIAAGSTTTAPTLAYNVTLPFLASGASVNTPTLAYAVSLPTIAAGTVVNAPVVALDGVISAPNISAGSVTFAPTVSPGAVTLTVPFISSGASLNVPALAYAVTMPFLSSTATVNSPTLAYQVTLPTISSGVAVNAPTLVYAITLPFLPSGAAIQAPTVAPGAVSLSLPTIAAASLVFAPTLAAVLQMPFLSSGLSLFAPAVALGTPGSNISNVAERITNYLSPNLIHRATVDARVQNGTRAIMIVRATKEIE